MITTGGASTGERDLVKSVFTELGAEFKFAHVAMRPGRPFGFAKWGDVPVCILPGNPAAAFVCFHKLVRPALARLSGHYATGLPRLHARLDADLHGRPGRRYFVLARLHCEAEGFVVKPLANQCSALVRTAAFANALVTVRETTNGSAGGLRQDEIIDVELLDWLNVSGFSRENFSAGLAWLLRSTGTALRTAHQSPCSEIP